MSKVILFPGQGAQQVGMGKDVCEAFSYANEMADQANEILGYDLKGLCFEGPGEELSKTENCQAAIYLTSAILFNIIEKEKGWGDISGVGGLSLGEYSALYAAGSLTFEDGLKLVRRRGQLMQEAGEKSPGTMASIIGMEEDQVRTICEEANGYVVPANMNCPGQIVVSGEIDAVKDACRLAKEQKGKAIELSVSGAFHSSLMEHAAEGLKEALDSVEIKAPKFKFTNNVSGGFVSDADTIRQGLIEQLMGSVLWQKNMEAWNADGDYNYFEVGPNRVLTGLMRKIDKSKSVTAINSLDAVNAYEG